MSVPNSTYGSEINLTQSKYHSLLWVLVHRSLPSIRNFVNTWLNTTQIVLMAHYEKLLIQMIHMAHICENDMLQTMFQIVPSGFNLALNS